MKQDELLKSYVKVTEDGVEGSAQAVSEFFRLAQVEEDTHEDEKEESVGFEKGDKVRLTLNGKENARFGLSTVKDGDVGKVIRVRENDYDDTVIDVEFPTHDDWTADPSELTKITDEEFASKIIKDGDIVVVIDNTSGSLNKVGDIGIVSECEYIGCKVTVPGGSDISNKHFHRDLRLADGAEKAQYYVNKAKEDGTYDEKERKQGRFAIGDIVYYEDDIWFENEGYGEVIGFGDLSGEPRVKAVSNFGIERRYVTNSENLTLVCKAENREDK